jgi:hypothetical protein
MPITEAVLFKDDFLREARSLFIMKRDFDSLFPVNGASFN